MQCLRPLGNIERALWLIDQMAPMNVTAVAQVRGPLDLARLRPALDLVQRRHPLLRVYIRQENGIPVYVSDAATIPLEVCERRSLTHWHSVATAERNRPVRWDVSPLVRVTVLHGQAESEIIATLHHLIGDGFSIVYFLRDLLSALSGQSASIELEPLPERPALETLLSEKTRGWEGLKNGARYAWEQARTFLQLRPQLLPEQKSIPIVERRSGFVHHILPITETSALLATCRSHGVTIHGALCAALLMAVAAEIRAERHSSTPVLGCLTPVNLRRTLGPPVGDDIGLFVGPIVTFHGIDADTQVFALAEQIVKGVHAARAASLPAIALALQSRLLPARISPQQVVQHSYHRLFGTVSVTNLGVLDIPTDYTSMHLDALHFAPANNPFGSLISLSVTTLSGRLFLNFNYNEGIVGPDRLERVVAATLRALR